MQGAGRKHSGQCGRPATSSHFTIPRDQVSLLAPVGTRNRETASKPAAARHLSTPPSLPTFLGPEGKARQLGQKAETRVPGLPFKESVVLPGMTRVQDKWQGCWEAIGEGGMDQHAEPCSGISRGWILEATEITKEPI